MLQRTKIYKSIFNVNDTEKVVNVGQSLAFCFLFWKTCYYMVYTGSLGLSHIVHICAHKQEAMTNPWPKRTSEPITGPQRDCHWETEQCLLDTYFSHLLTWKICIPRMVSPRVREASISLLSWRNKIL